MDMQELRIGDIVTTNGKPMGTKEGDYYRVVSIDSKSNLGNYLTGSASIEPIADKDFGYVGAWVNYLKPIPITDELLEKIGFSKDGIGIFQVENFKYDFVAMQVDAERIYKSGIIFLHQLQHEMFDAGIECKIELE